METNTKEYTPKAFRQFKILDVVLPFFFLSCLQLLATTEHLFDNVA